MDKKVLETIKLLGAQVLEMRDVIKEQQDSIAELQDEILHLKKSDRDIKGDLKLVTIDQRDLSNQMKKLRANVAPVTNNVIEEPSFKSDTSALEDIYQTYYPSYKGSKVMEDTHTLAASRVKAPSPKFSRVPKFLDL